MVSSFTNGVVVLSNQLNFPRHKYCFFIIHVHNYTCVYIHFVISALSLLFLKMELMLVCGLT